MPYEAHKSSPAKTIATPQKGFHPAVNVGAWLQAKADQGHPIDKERLERISTPHHLIETPTHTRLNRIAAIVRKMKRERGLTGPRPLILTDQVPS
ncbi:hypothetical protein J7426_14435 [Tropicibacter sp. R16_0]|uniref:hypothetical protein n=1 Tax=Tropicibacter sp. R16_0 TaxID=2821102 RepID=UPI001ADBEC22|nr:hypothetical protein [Tropicibacter sp. R16_0]MBO9451468.1 hypothetical protein [Tropicibacter sp. R16_0]